MGICESKIQKEYNEKKPDIQISKSIKSNLTLKSNKREEKNNNVDESIINSQSFLKLEAYDLNVSRSICNITIETREGKKTGNGFFLKFYISKKIFYFLVSNEHFISNDIINRNPIINIIYDKSKNAYIKLDVNERKIKTFKDLGLDVILVEILEKDNISKECFLFFEKDEINKSIINSTVNIIKILKDVELKDEGKITKINKYNFLHSAGINKDSLGFPIILEKTNNIIGINGQENSKNAEFYGYFIFPAIDRIKNDILKRINMVEYKDGKYKWEDGTYYEGKISDNLPNGKGKKYNKNGNVLYEGDFINGQFEGKGKYIYDNGDYYEGQYKKGLQNGEGTLYYKNGDIMAQGNFTNDMLEGNGKYFFENGSYYEGEWKKGMRHGKGKEYYSNRKIKYDGDYFNDKKEGNGKYVFENGSYYIGKWKNGFKNGKGIEYYSDGNIMYEGDFINGKREGHGKYIWEDGTYYIGQYKNGLKHGKGTEYYSNGQIWYEGDFIMGEKEGNGKYIWEDGEYYIGQWKNGFIEGKGKMCDANGNVKQEGNWINDEFIEK